MFSGDGDLYWIINNIDCLKNKEYSYDYFEITKENYAVYALFEQLVNDIKNINIFDKLEIEFQSYIDEDIEMDEELDKQRYRKFNMSHYNDLYDEKTNTITWISDETAFKIANKVQIKKIKDKFIIEFSTQPYIEGYEK